MTQMTKFEEDLKKINLEEQSEDKYGGTRYQVRIAGGTGRLRLPPIFYRMSKLRLDEMYTYIYPEENDEDFERVSKAVDELTTAVLISLGSKVKEITPLIKTDKNNGMIVKPYFRYDGEAKKITSKFFDSDSKLMVPESDERVASDRFTKTIYPILDIDSVYVSAEGKASIQVKISECVLYTKEIESVLDLDLINKMRAMKLKKKTAPGNSGKRF